MALKALILRKKIDAAQKRMDAFREKDAEFQKGRRSWKRPSKRPRPTMT